MKLARITTLVLVAGVALMGCGGPTLPPGTGNDVDDDVFETRAIGDESAVDAQGAGTDGNLVYVSGPDGMSYRLEVYANERVGTKASEMECWYGTFPTKAGKPCDGSSTPDTMQVRVPREDHVDPPPPTATPVTCTSDQDEVVSNGVVIACS